MTFGVSWGDCDGLLTTEENGLPSNQQGLLLQAETLRPRSAHLGDCEIEIHHDIDGPIQGFGKRLWLHVSERHALTQTLLTDKNSQITAIVYRDRYLFTPLSVALLATLIASLRDVVGDERWDSTGCRVITTNRRSGSPNNVRNMVWSDWLDTTIRDQVLVATFSYLGIDALVSPSTSAQTGHSRSVEVDWSCGKKLALRLDQGVSYWRAAQRSRTGNYFNLNERDLNLQGRRLAELSTRVEGAELPTQLFVKVR
ncbi:MAG: hypothetical protein ACREXW_08210 [Gammaproteobacteria bacterium]